MTQIRTSNFANYVRPQTVDYRSETSAPAVQPAYSRMKENPYRGDKVRSFDPFLTHSFDRKIIGWHQLGIRKDQIEALYSHRLQTGQEHSLFWHYSGYEIRTGDLSEEATESTTLGGEIFNPEDERFFGTKFLGHIHLESPTPSIRDLKVIGARTLPDPEDPQKRPFVTHTVFGFTDSGPAFMQFTAIYNKRTDRVVFQRFRTSANVSDEMFDQLKDRAQKAAKTISSSDAGRKVHAQKEKTEKGSAKEIGRRKIANKLQR